MFNLCVSDAIAEMAINVNIEGLEQKHEENVRLLMSLVQQKDHEFLTEGRIRRLHEKALSEIKQALQPFGFYRVGITARLEKLEPNVWRASYQIDTGNPIPIGKVTFHLLGQAQQDPAFSALTEKSSLKSGNTFSHLEYENFKTELSQLASERGYFNARFKQHRVEIDLKKYTANIYLDFESGARFNFGDIIFSIYPLEEPLLRRYIPFTRGQPYDLESLLEFQQVLINSDYFSMVEVSPGQPDADSHEIPVIVNLTPKKRHRFGFGLGYGTDTGVRAQASWAMPRINHKGHRLSTSANVSELGYQLKAQYSLPVFNPVTDQLIYSAGIVNEQTDTSESTIDTIGISLSQKRGQWRENYSLNFQSEKYEVADDRGQTDLLMPGINWSRTWGQEFWGNQIIKAFDGIRLDLGIRTAHTDLLSDVTFSQAQVSVKAVHRITDRHRLISRVKLGAIDTAEFDLLPGSIRFFAGGAQSVRGFRYQSLSEKDENGDVSGGQYLLEGSLEYEYSFNSRWGVAFFFDTGNALNNLDQDLEQGAGFGMRWNSPIGPVRVDLASALTLEDDPWRLHINIGPDL